MNFRLVALLALIFSCLPAAAADFSSQVLAEMNLARTEPQNYAAILASRMSGPRSSKAVQEAIRFLKRAKPLPALEYSAGMSMGARMHVEDLGPRGGRGHYGTGGSTPFERLNRFGQWAGHAGENIYYGSRDARGVVCALLVDEGVPGRKHRQNIFSRSYRVAGVAYGGHAGFGAMCVMDFASDYRESGSQFAGL